MTIRYPNTTPPAYTPNRPTSPYTDRTADLRQPKKRVDAWHEAAIALGFEYQGNGNYTVTISDQCFLLFTGRFFGRKVKLGGALITDMSFSKTDSPRDVYDALWVFEKGFRNWTEREPDHQGAI